MEISFMTIAADFSGEDPVILPPKDVPRDQLQHVVRAGEKISFRLGGGPRSFLPDRLPAACSCTCS